MSKLVRYEREITGAVGVAEDVGYNNVSSGLEASNVQEAIDELNSDLTDITDGWETVNDVTYASIVNVNTSNITHKYNSILKMGIISGKLVTNDALSAYSGQNLIQITQHLPNPCGITIFNLNQTRAHNCIINASGQLKYADVTAINGGVVFNLDYLYKYN